MEPGVGASPAYAAPRNSMLDVEFAQLSDLGKVRDHNEDYLGHAKPATPEQARTQGWLFALADGVGGHELGEVASRTAVESLLAGFREATGEEAHSTLLPGLVRGANQRVYEAGLAAGAQGPSMATTLVACAVRFDRAVVAHVGDSRCYLIRLGQAMQLTRDHTVAADQERLGLLSAREAAKAETRHVLSRSLGSDLFVNVEVGEHQVFAEDVLLLCCDGLYGEVSAMEMAAIVTHNASLEAAARRMVALANHRGGGDNISVQLIRIRGVERVGMYRGRPYRLH
jgi:protein phosphatase